VLVRVRARARRVRIGVADHVKKILGHRMRATEGPNTRAPVPLRVRAERTSWEVAASAFCPCRRCGSFLDQMVCPVLIMAPAPIL
jgi:hypothetical protein